MYINTELINWWINKDALSPEEHNLVTQKRPEDVILSQSDIDNDNMTKRIINLLPFCNINEKDYTVRFDTSLTSIIKQIFERHVKDDTLIISTDREHFSSSKIIEKHQHVYLLSHEKEIRKNKIDGAIRAAEDFDNVFVFIIGTQKGSGEITPQTPIESTIKTLKAEGKNVIAVSDDVHGWFFTPRDYSSYDYILHTAHSLPTFFDLGVCIQKKTGIIIGNAVKNWCEMWLDILQLFLARKEKLLMFQKVVTEAAIGMFGKYNVGFVSYNNPNFFTLTIPKAANNIITEEEIKTLEGLHFYFDKVEAIDNCSYIAARGQQFIVEPDKLIKGLNYLDTVFARLHKEGAI